MSSAIAEEKKGKTTSSVRPRVTAPLAKNTKPRCETCGGFKRDEKYSVIEIPEFTRVKPATSAQHVPKYVQEFYLKHLSGELMDKKKFDRLTRGEARHRMREFGLVPRIDDTYKTPASVKAEQNRRAYSNAKQKKEQEKKGEEDEKERGKDKDKPKGKRRKRSRSREKSPSRSRSPSPAPRRKRKQKSRKSSKSRDDSSDDSD